VASGKAVGHIAGQGVAIGIDRRTTTAGSAQSLPLHVGDTHSNIEIPF
jgi:hypothetical protein